MPYGIVPTGFNRKTLAVIQAETTAAFQAVLGANINLDPREPIGQIKGVLDEREAELWELAEFVYNGFYVLGAEGIGLDKLVRLNNVTRLQASKSSAIVTILGTSGTIIPIGFRLSVVNDTATKFETIQIYTIPLSGTIDIEVFAQVAGRKFAPAGTLTIIDTPVLGVTSANNLADADVGSEIETDAALKTRRGQSLIRRDSVTDEGIRAALLNQVAGVDYAVVISNRTNFVDGEGRPPKSFEAYVQGGADQDIWDLIWSANPAGIESYGTEIGTVIDSTGQPQTLKFSRIVNVRIIADITIVPNTNPGEGPVYPALGDDMVKDALVAYFLTFLPNNDVINSATYVAINTVPGIRGITALYARFGDPLTSANIPISPFELATLLVGDIVVNS